MTEDMNQDLDSLENPLDDELASLEKKSAASEKASGTDLAKSAGTKPAPKTPAKKPAPAKPLREASMPREEDLFPSDDEEDEEADEPLFGDEPEGELDGDLPADAVLLATDTSERIILVVDEDGQRRNETVAIISQILPNAEIEVANDPEDALAMMDEGDFDTFVVNFLMPGYSSSAFVKAVANHPEHPLLIGFAADKMSDAVDPKKGLKIIPLKRLFDLDTANSTETPEGEPPED
jgi:hypothetical protein